MEEPATFRRATERDLEAIARIHVESWRATYRGIVPDTILEGLSVDDRLVAWQGWYVTPGAEIWLAARSASPVAFSRLVPAATDRPGRSDTAEITHLYALPAVVGGGIGHSLFSRMLARARQRGSDSLTLWVLEENQCARRFYEGSGMRSDGARQTRPEWLGEGVYEVRYDLELECSGT
ncbi:MAG: GNAT family N-acetyltransferase [Deltaproteobacteria bacterium]|jgi:GNAT superfamily N-acetyltransferase|nr:GNAT family N-acetyltransferase [Deltaproteobacteria bacterium]